jgi:hypothetical protein
MTYLPDPPPDQYVLRGDHLLPREVAHLLYTHGWRDVVTLAEMVAVVYAESGAYTEAVSRENRNGSRDYGLFQLSYDPDVQTMSRDEWKAMAFTPDEAAEYASELFERRGFQPWFAYGTANYERQLRKSAGGVANFLAVELGLEPVPYFYGYRG